MSFLPVCTYSIVARDAETRSLGIAVQSRHFDVGSRVPWAEAGVGAVATQAFIEPGYGPRAIERMTRGATASDTLAALLSDDPQRELRQVAVLDDSGGAAAHTGALAVPFAGHRVGDGFSVQGNMLATDAVCDAMQREFESAAGSLAERLLDTLDAGQAAGGDLRGMQAAALLIVRPISAEEPWLNRIVDLRVEDDHAPIAELRRLHGLLQAKDALDRARAATLEGRPDEARAAFEAGVELSGHNDEFLFWGGLALARMGDEARGGELLRAAIEKNPAWRTMLERLPAPMRPPQAFLARLLG